MPKDTNTRGADTAAAAAAEQGYKVGPGCPPREYQFKPGQSGNPKGAKRKPKSIAPGLKAALERALNKKIKLKQGDEERIVTMATAGIEQLVARFAKGDRHALRDLFPLADRFGVDLIAGHQNVIADALAANHAAILQAYVHRQTNKVVTAEPVLAPPELLDDDPEGPKEN